MEGGVTFFYNWRKHEGARGHLKCWYFVMEKQNCFWCVLVQLWFVRSLIIGFARCLISLEVDSAVGGIIDKVAADEVLITLKLLAILAHYWTCGIFHRRTFVEVVRAVVLQSRNSYLCLRLRLKWWLAQAQGLAGVGIEQMGRLVFFHFNS